MWWILFIHILHGVIHYYFDRWISINGWWEAEENGFDTKNNAVWPWLWFTPFIGPVFLIFKAIVIPIILACNSKGFLSTKYWYKKWGIIK